MSVELTADAKAALESIGSFAKNFLPIMFNIHQTEPPERRRQLQETIGVYASVSPPALLAEFFKVWLGKLGAACPAAMLRTLPGTPSHCRARHVSR